MATRLGAGFGLLILLFILCTGIAFNALSDARAGMENAVNVKMKKYQIILDMRGALRDMDIAVRNLALFSDPVIQKQEQDRITAQQALYVENRLALAGMMKIESTPAGRKTFRKMEGLEREDMPTYEKAAQLGDAA
ncbi:MCP four helix bundle domain-containing protein [Pantoea agglomerans]|uniref:MCP four helix bundle domain-containing protein n=1 Tax=Enterobacter agglomerans TaxID=549 RepID=UPI003015AE13